MNQFLLLLFALGTVLASFAIEEPRVIRQSELLVNRVKKEHVAPRPVDDAFGKSVHALFIESLDPYHFVFTQEDLTEFESLSLQIDDDINGKQLSYLKKVVERFEKNTSAFQSWSEQYLQKPSVFTKTTIQESRLTKNAPLSAQNQRWKEIVMLEVIERILGYMPENSTSFPKDSIVVWDGKARTAAGKYYTSLFEALKSDASVIENAYLTAIAMSFDPHTMYFSSSDKKDFEQELSSERELFGFSFGEGADGKLTITNVVPGSPAWISDQVHEGDVIIRVGLKGKPVFSVEDQQKGYQGLREYLNDNEAKQLTLYLINEKGEELRVELTKQKIYSDGDVIKNAVLKGTHNLGYISLPDFYVNWTDPNGLGCSNDVAKCLVKLMKENIGGLILDLRGNGGGSLREAVDMAGLFIDYGPILAVREKDNQVEVLRDINRGSVYNGPLIIMVDAGSASASEIVAGVLQDYRKAIIVGEQTFGKATSQSVYPINPMEDSQFAAYIASESANGYANITNGELYRVTGAWNQVNGVTPDVTLPFRFSLKFADRERDYQNVLVPDSLPKKMTFTPSPVLPLESLKAASESRISTEPVLQKYQKLVVELEQLYVNDSILHFSPEEQWNANQKWEQKRSELEACEKQLNPGFTAVSNQFDEATYRAADWLWEYHQRFLEELQQDVELMETVNIMNDWINQNK